MSHTRSVNRPFTLLITAMMLSFVAASGCSHRHAFLVSVTKAPVNLLITRHVDHVETLAREPMIVEHPNGTLFLSGYNRRAPHLWKSTDNGATWTRIDVGTEAQGAIGNSDMDLAIAPDGTLYYITLGYDPVAQEGTHVSIGVSRDLGARWSWTMVSKKRFDDRPWIAACPKGEAHAIWNDGTGVYHTLSRDNGATWSSPVRIHEEGGSGHLAIGPNCEIAVRITPLAAAGTRFTPGVDLIAVSTDGGSSWQKYPAPGEREWSPPDSPAQIERWVEPLAWDSQGALYSLWTNTKGIWLARSANQGKTWKTWLVVPSSETLYFPYLAARGSGELAATWFSGSGNSLRWHAAIFQHGSGSDRPRVNEFPGAEIDCWRADKRDTCGEYLPVLFLKNHEIAVAVPIENPAMQRYGFSFWVLAPH